MFELYAKYWENLSNWADDSVLKQQVTIIGIPFVIQFLVGSFFTLSDLGLISWMQRLKIQEKKKIPVDQKRIMDALKVFLKNLLIVYLLFYPVIIKITDLRGNVYDSNVPSLKDFIFNIIGIVLIEDVWFFSMHRLLHTKFFFENIHKIHHKWPQPTALSVFYVHPIEFILAIPVNIHIGYWITGNDFVTSLTA